MNVHQFCNLSNFMPLLPGIRNHIAEWRMIHIRLTPGSPYNVAYVARQLHAFFGAGCEGALYLSDANEVFMLCRPSGAPSAETLSKQLVAALPHHNGDMHVAAVTADELLKIQIGLQEKKEGGGAPVSPLLAIRQDRLEDVVLVADDDELMRSLIGKCFGGFSQIIELNDLSSVVETYLLELPDIVFLDVHMPGGSGLNALAEILMFDPTAHIVMLSSDRVEGTVLDAKKFGAKGYVAKPFTPEKLISCYNKVTTVQKQAL